MKYLWCTWKDTKNPAAGGAEIVNEEIAKRLARDGHQVIFLVAGFAHFNSAEAAVSRDRDYKGPLLSVPGICMRIAASFAPGMCDAEQPGL